MSESDKELCLKEISSDVLDGGKTVNISTLSENWGFSLKQSADLLEKWLEEHDAGKSFYKQFLVRGVACDGSLLVTILPEGKIASLKKKYTKIVKMLYSVKEGPEPSAIVISSLLDYKSKRIVLPHPETKREPLNYACKTPDEPSTKEVKQEKSNAPSSTKNASSNLTNGHSSNGIASMFKNVKSEPKSPAKSQTQTNNGKITPKKTSPAKKEAGKKSGSIGSFFSKPQTKSGKPSNQLENEKVKETVVKVEIASEPKSEVTNGKRSPVSNDNSENDSETKSTKSTQNPPKRRKVEEKPKLRAKGSRIMVMADSDDEDETEPKSTEKVSEECEESSQEEHVPVNKTPTVSVSKSGRAKKRRVVAKTYEDEDGFIQTVKESVEYSCSEPESEDVEPVVKAQKEEAQPKQEEKKKTKISPTKTAKPARKAPSKQGSIMSFFSKK